MNIEIARKSSAGWVMAHDKAMHVPTKVLVTKPAMMIRCSLPEGAALLAKIIGAYSIGSLLSTLSKPSLQLSVLISPKRKSTKNEAKMKASLFSRRRCHFSRQSHSNTQFAVRKMPAALIAKLETGIAAANAKSRKMYIMWCICLRVNVMLFLRG